MPAGTLKVFLIGAVGIKDTEVFGKGDPYANLLCGKQKLRSNTASNQGSEPIWNQMFSFAIEDKTTELKIRIYNCNFLTDDDVLGGTIIPLGKVFADGKLATTSYNVVRPSGRVQGKVQLSIAFTPKEKNAGVQTVQDIPGPSNATVHGSSHATGPGARHDVLTGPQALDVGSSQSNQPPEVQAYPPTTYRTVSAMSASFHRTQSGASDSSDDSSHRGRRLYSVAPPHPSPPPPSIATDYDVRMYAQSLFPLSAPPHHLAAGTQDGSASSSLPPSVYPPPDLQNPPYPPPGIKPPLQFQVDNLAGNFGSMKISSWNDSTIHSDSSQVNYPGYHNSQSFSDNNIPSAYPRSDSLPGHSNHDYSPVDRPASGSYPPSDYPTPAVYPPQYESRSQGEYLKQRSYSLHEYQVPPSSFYPQQLRVFEQRPYGWPDAGGPPPPPENSYPPAS